MENKVKMRTGSLDSIPIPELNNFHNKLVGKLAEGIIQSVELYVRIHIQPKPKWLPKWLWYKILKRLLVLQRFSDFNHE
ncbi:MAG: hypothetical protein ACTSUX_06385 [Promethearchaeota archaeon]